MRNLGIDIERERERERERKKGREGRILLMFGGERKRGSVRSDRDGSERRTKKAAERLRETFPHPIVCQSITFLSTFFSLLSLTKDCPKFHCNYFSTLQSKTKDILSFLFHYQQKYK